MEKIVDTMNYLHKAFSKHEEILSGKHPYWLKSNILERRIVHMVLTSLSYLQMKYVNTYENLINKLYIYSSAN